MITFDNKSIKIKGSRIDLMAELVCIMRYFIEREVITKEQLLEYAVLACFSKEDIKQAMIDTIDEMDNIGDAWKLLHELERMGI